MSNLLARVLEVHGGLDRWRERTSLTAAIVTGGGLWALKGLVQDPTPRQMTVMLHEETAYSNSGGGRGIRTPKGLAARWISSPLPYQLRLALRASRIA